MDIITAKILRKKVDDRTYNGATKISFMVSSRGEEKWLSAFVDEKKMPPEVVQLFRELGEGDKAEFQYEEVPGKGRDGKPATYRNIKSLTRVTDIHEESPAKSGGQRIPAESTPYLGKEGNVQPVRQGIQEGDTKVRSMALAYAKDLAIGTNDIGILIDDEHIIRRAKRFEQYILSGE